MTKNRNVADILDQHSTFTVSLSAGANVIANTTTIVVGNSIVNTVISNTQIAIGNSTVNALANSVAFKLANSTVTFSLIKPTAAQVSSADYYPASDGVWKQVVAGATPGGSNTHIQYNDSTILGGSAGFTFDEVTNNVIIANTLTVGTATINSSNYSQTANNALNLGGLAAAGYANLSIANFTTSVNVGANVGLTTSQVKLINSVANTTLVPGNINLSGSEGVVDVGPPAGTAAATTDDGLWLTGSGRLPAGIFTEVTGNIFSVALNTPQISNRTNAMVGGIFRFDARPTNQEFVVIGYANTGNVEANLMSLSLQTGAAKFSNGVFPVSNTTGQVFGNTISRWVITGNSATLSTSLDADTVNAVTSVNSALIKVGTAFIANTLGAYHTGIVNAASYTTTGFLANATHVVPTSNSSGQTLGNTISRWVITANSVTVSGGISPDSNTLGTALGTATQRWVLTGNSAALTGALTSDSVNAVTSVNSALVTVGTAFVANTTGAYHTGIINAAVFTTTGFRANTIGTYPTSNSSGQNFGNTISRWAIFANTIDLTTSLTANGSLGGASQILTSNSLGGVYWAAPSGGGNVSKVGTPVDDQVGVWTGDGTIEGTAGFTFSAATNNAVIANTLTVGTATINSTNYSQTANNALNLGGTAAAGYQTTAGLPANVAILAANSATYLTGANAIANVTGLYVNGTARFTGPVSETATGADRIDVGVQSGSPRMIFENDAGLIWEIDNDVPSGNVFRWFTPSVVQMTLGAGSLLTLPNTSATLTLSTGTANVIANTTLIRVANSTSSANHGAGSFVVGSTLANSTGVYAGTVNAASFTTTGFLANVTHVVPTSNSSGQNFGNTISRWVLTANSVTTSGGVSPDSNTLGTALGTITQRWVLLANTIESTGLANLNALNVVNQVNAATVVATTSMASGNATQNTTTYSITGNTTTAPSLILSSNSTTSILYGNTTVTGAPTITLSNSITNAVLTSLDLKLGGTATIANTLGVYTTGTMNAASFTTTGFKANTIGTYPTSNSSGQNFGNSISRWIMFANSIDLTTSITANGALGVAAQVLTSNSLGGVYWATAAGGGDVTKVGTPVDNQVGVWTGSGTIEGTAGFTFDASTNNATIANTLTVGTATINSTNYSQTANNALNLGGTAAASYQLNSTLAANVATMTANNATWHGTSVFANSTGAYPTSNTVGAVLGNTISRVIITGNSATFSSTLAATDTTITGFVNATVSVNSATHTIGSTFIANTLGVYHTGTVNAASFTTTGFLANVTHVVPTSNSSGQNFGNTISRWIITANSAALSTSLTADTVNAVTSVNSALVTVGTAFVANTTGAYHTGIINAASHTTTGFLANATHVVPTSNSSGQSLGNTISRWVITGNSATFSSTLAATDTTITGFVNATVVVNSAAHTIGSTFIANTLGVYHTGTMNAASFTTTGFRANTIGVYPTSNSSGQLFGNTISRWAIFANTIDVTTSITANGSLGGAAQILTSNSLGGVYWAASAGGGAGYYKGDAGIAGSAGNIVNIFRINANTLNTDVTIAAGENAQATGPLTLPAGVDLVISTGGRVSII